MRKSQLRETVREVKRQFTSQQLEAMSLSVIARLKTRLGDAHTILAYYSLPDEVNTHQFIDELVAEGRVVLLPKVIDDERMEIRRYTGAEDLREGRLHLMEPVGDTFTDYARIDVALIPGMAFDAKGCRLGRGRGYYDRFLPLISTAQTIGVCFPFQKVAEVPVEETDIPVDEVV